MGGADLMQSVAIAIPVYNGEAYLALAIESALGQRRAADQIVAVDDKSTDRTPEILQRYSERIVVRSLDQRVPAPEAWNTAVRSTSAEFVVVLAHDDLLHQGFLEAWQVAMCSDQTIDLFVTGHEVIDDTGVSQEVHRIEDAVFHVPGPVSSEQFLDRFTRDGQFFLPSGVVFRRSAFDEVGGFDPRIRVAYDWEFFLRLAPHARIYIDPEPRFSYRVHEGQSIVGHTRFDNGDSDLIFKNLPRIGRYFTDRQKRWLVANMCDFQRRFATWPIADLSVPPGEVVDRHRRIRTKLRQWRQMCPEYSMYVRVMPRRWRQWLMWNCGNSETGVRLARMLLRNTGVRA